jgi:hypothetical protein
MIAGKMRFRKTMSPQFEFRNLRSELLTCRR